MKQPGEGLYRRLMRVFFSAPSSWLEARGSIGTHKFPRGARTPQKGGYYSFMRMLLSVGSGAGEEKRQFSLHDGVKVLPPICRKKKLRKSLFGDFWCIANLEHLNKRHLLPAERSRDALRYDLPILLIWISG